MICITRQVSKTHARIMTRRLSPRGERGVTKTLWRKHVPRMPQLLSSWPTRLKVSKFLSYLPFNNYLKNPININLDNSDTFKVTHCASVSII